MRQMIPSTKDENRNQNTKSLQAPNSLIIIGFHKIGDFYLVFWDFLLPSLIHQTSVFQIQVDRNKLEEYFHYLEILAPQVPYLLRCWALPHIWGTSFWQVELSVIAAPLMYVLFQEL